MWYLHFIIYRMYWVFFFRFFLLLVGRLAMQKIKIAFDLRRQTRQNFTIFDVHFHCHGNQFILSNEFQSMTKPDTEQLDELQPFHSHFISSEWNQMQKSIQNKKKRNVPFLWILNCNLDGEKNMIIMNTYQTNSAHRSHWMRWYGFDRWRDFRLFHLLVNFQPTNFHMEIFLFFIFQFILIIWWKARGKKKVLFFNSM